VIYDWLVYVGVGEDPEHAEGVGHLWCIDPTKRGDVSPELAFNSADPNKPIAPISDPYQMYEKLYGQLKDKESLHLYADAIDFYLQRSSVSEIISAIEVTCGLAEQLPAGNDDQDVDLDVLPSKFKVLIPFIRKWGVTDDLERSELLEKASRKTLERLVQLVTPHLSSIDEYLNSFGEEPLSEAAIALGALAECTVEAQLQIGHQNSE
jgi:hypothetical protein